MAGESCDYRKHATPMSIPFFFTKKTNKPGSRTRYRTYHKLFFFKPRFPYLVDVPLHYFCSTLVQASSRLQAKLYNG